MSTVATAVPAAAEFGAFLEREAASLINAEGNLMEVLGPAAPRGLRKKDARPRPGIGGRRKKRAA